MQWSVTDRPSFCGGLDFRVVLAHGITADDRNILEPFVPMRIDRNAANWLKRRIAADVVEVLSRLQEPQTSRIARAFIGIDSGAMSSDSVVIRISVSCALARLASAKNITRTASAPTIALNE